MKLYKGIDYPENKREVSQSIVDILTSDEPSSLEQSDYDENFEGLETRSFGINYGTKKGDRSPVLRGLQFEDLLFEIDKENKRIISHHASGQLFYDEDKIPVKNQFVIEGTLNDVLQKFTDRGYSCVKSEEFKNYG
ncbi:hypothetical protein KY312_01490, partial [Candidatus Woesearchaeota archaeon]|nr:hypothetical protein [Candidatus Woesearchaeota archaeon]